MTQNKRTTNAKPTPTTAYPAGAISIAYWTKYLALMRKSNNVTHIISREPREWSKAASTPQHGRNMIIT